LRISVNAQGVPLTVLLQRLAADYGISVVSALELDSQPITLTLNNVPIDEAMSALSRRVGSSAVRVGSVYFVGSEKIQDRAALVRRVSFLDRDTAESVIKSFSSSAGTVAITPQGVAVAGDTVEVVARMNAMLDQLESMRGHVWLVQLYVFNLSDTWASDFGIEGASTIDLAAAISSAGGTSALASAGLKAVVKASLTSDRVNLETAPMFVLVEGQTVELSDGQTVPVPKRAVSNEGTSTVTEYVNFKAGLNIKLTVRPSSATRAQLDLDYSHDKIVRFVGDAAPATDGFKIKQVSEIESGGVYLLAQANSRDSSDSGQLGLTVSSRQNRATRSVQIWARAVRVAGVSKKESE